MTSLKNMYVISVGVRMNEKIRKNFPFLKRKMIYLDNAATTQKPKQIINAVKNFYENNYANVHRGVYKLSQEATEKYEAVRKKTAKMINSKSNEIIFTKNTTESLNLIAKSLNLKKGDEIILTEMEHHSNIIPWMMLKKIKLKYIPVNKNGELKINEIEKLITKKTKAISCTHVSNFLGTINPVEKICKIAKKHNLISIIDGAQSAPHKKIDVKKINCDFFAFSSHKMCGPTGVGILYGKRKILEKTKPFLGGGEMIESVDFKKFKTSEIPWKFEAGTPNIAGVIGFGAAIDYLEKIKFEKIQRHEQNLIKFVINEFKKIKNIEIYGPEDYKKRCGLISFNIKKMDAHNIAGILDNYNICIRSGHHCVMPMHKKMKINGSARASFYIYNTKKEAEIFVNKIKNIAESLK